MNLLFSAIGTIIGALIFVVADYRVLVPAFICLFISSLAFTTLHRYKTHIISLLTFILIMFFNYNFRAEHLQFINPSEIYSGTESQYLKIETPPNANNFFQEEFIVSLKKRSPNLGDRIHDLFIPYRFLVISKSAKGFRQGDIINLGSENPEFKTLNKFKAKFLKKEKVFFEIKSKEINFERHELDIFSDTRHQIKRYFLKTLGQEKGLITSSLLFGSSVAKIPGSVMEDIRRLGLSHIFAASGFHLMLLAGFLQLIFTKLKINSKLESLLIISASLIYSGLAGFCPSIMRSAICITAFYLAKLANRKIDNLKLLTSLAGIVVFIDPYSILDIGLQLSYLATIAIIIWAGPINKNLEADFTDKLKISKSNASSSISHRILNYTRESLAISFAVQTLIAPLTLYYFKCFPLWSILANLIFTPLLSLIIVLSALGLSFIINPLLSISLYLFKLSAYLPFANYQIDFSFPSMLILLVLLNFLALSYCNKDLISSKFLKAGLVASLVLLVMAKTFPVYGIQEFYVRYGHFDNFLDKEIHEMKKNKINYKYFSKAGLEGLIILELNSLSKLKSLNTHLREIHLLVLPHLKADSIYLETLTRVLKPQFILIASKSKSKRVEENLKLLKEESNVIFNEGKLVVSDKKYWRIYN